MKAMGQCSKGDLCSFSHNNRSLLHQKRSHKLTERNPQKVGASEESPCRKKPNCVPTFPYVTVGTLPFVSITSLNQDAHAVENSDTLRG